MDREHFPELKLTREEIIFLQELLNQERQDLFNYYEDLQQEYQEMPAKRAYRAYMVAKRLRNKLYHMTGRDTLALGPEVHEQRWWDQQHDYEEE